MRGLEGEKTEVGIRGTEGRYQRAEAIGRRSESKERRAWGGELILKDKCDDS